MAEEVRELREDGELCMQELPGGIVGRGADLPRLPAGKPVWIET